jgi:hypothetical protein
MGMNFGFGREMENLTREDRKTNSSTAKEKSQSPTLIRVGNLFMSITYMGKNSWGDCVRSLRQSNEGGDIVVLSGVHGTEGGMATKTMKHGGKTVWTKHKPLEGKKGIIDDSHITDDLAVATSLRSNFNDVGTVSVAKAYGSRDTATSAKLKTLTKGLLDSGKLVIWGWCSSLYSMREYESGTQPNWRPDWEGPVKSVVSSDFAWV